MDEGIHATASSAPGTHVDRDIQNIQEALQAAQAYLDDAGRRPLSAEEAFDIQRTRGLVAAALKALPHVEAEILRRERARRIKAG
ncbi:MAG: hypothetical protein KDB82_11715 [Planctomycetes bacterium]|nr:hypothetical protein [Planctomycetota bacterium]